MTRQDNIRDNRLAMANARRQRHIHHAVRVYEGKSYRRPVGRSRTAAKKRSAEAEGLQLLLGVVAGLVVLMYLFA